MQARNEDKSFSRLCEVLLLWSLEQLEANGINSTTLKTWQIQARAQGTEVPATLDEKSYRKELGRQVLTDSQRTAVREKVSRDKGHRAHSESDDEQEKAPRKTDRDRTSTG